MIHSEQQKLLQQGLTELKLSLSEQQQEKLLHYVQLLLKWNRVYNLTAAQSADEIIIQHILDSLTIATYLQGATVIDVGTGAGLPGIPLAIVFPQKKFVLLDSIGKKTRFLLQVVAELNLNNIEVVQARAEEFHPPTGFDVVVTRAVAAATDIIDIAWHLLNPKGQLLLMKGAHWQEELKGIQHPAKVERLLVPKLNKERHLIIITRD